MSETHIAQSKKHGDHQTAHAGRGERHEQEQAGVAQQREPGNGPAQGSRAQQGQQSQQGECPAARPPERNAAQSEILIQGAAGSHAKIDVIAQSAPGAEGSGQQRDAQRAGKYVARSVHELPVTGFWARAVPGSGRKRRRVINKAPKVGFWPKSIKCIVCFFRFVKCMRSSGKNLNMVSRAAAVLMRKSVGDGQSRARGLGRFGSSGQKGRCRLGLEPFPAVTAAAGNRRAGRKRAVAPLFA